MKTSDVPQDLGMIGEYGREVCYAVDSEGKYTLSQSLGWEPKNIVNSQAWDTISEEIEKALELVQQKRVSPIAVYQAKHQMDLSLLAQYVGMAKWRVKRHLKPKIFNKLSDKILLRYCDVFGITLDELRNFLATNKSQQ